METGTLTKDIAHASDLFVAIIEKLLTQKMLDQSFDQQVTPSQVVALRYLSLNESSLMSDVAEGLGISFPAATKTIDRLVRKSLVNRTEDPHDRRVVRIRLTEQGKQLVEEINQERSRRFATVLERMDPRSLNSLHQSMEKFINAAIDDEDTARSLCLHCGSEHHEDCPIKVAYLRLTRASGS
ncbi:MAG: MarR family winged helix-turn-helix transcriptional regulator [Chloroflexota bacterium]|jgi:DNA-binding MarR family transcriptional regulator